jgi:hypothetical protein
MYFESRPRRWGKSQQHSNHDFGQVFDFSASAWGNASFYNVGKSAPSEDIIELTECLVCHLWSDNECVHTISELPNPVPERWMPK